MHGQERGILLAGATLWCLSILAAPAFDLSPVYRFFAAICHQNPARSWYVFGEPMPVCIRCASIYFAFTASLWIGIRPNVRWLGFLSCSCLSNLRWHVS